jgi:DNA-binding GntR family transcriptional regulator
LSSLKSTPDGPSMRDSSSLSLSNRSLAEQAYESLKDRIFTLSLMPGDRLSESELAETLGLSRTPLRQALQRLQHEGFVEAQPRVGWIIPQLSFQRLDALYDFRILLECFAVKTICLAEGTRPGLVSLSEIWCASPDERSRDPKVVGGLDESFHTEIVSLAGNPEITKTYAEIVEKIRLVRRLDFLKDYRVDATYVEHARILKALLTRRTDEAQRLLTAHIDQSKIEVRKITLDMLYQARDAHIPAPTTG